MKTIKELLIKNEGIACVSHFSDEAVVNDINTNDEFVGEVEGDVKVYSHNGSLMFDINRTFLLDGVEPFGDSATYQLDSDKSVELLEILNDFGLTNYYDSLDFLSSLDVTEILEDWDIDHEIDVNRLCLLVEKYLQESNETD